MSETENDEQKRANCLANWPDAESGAYNPSCCRFPKSCSVPSPPVTATPDRPATTPEGAGLAALSEAAYPGPWRADDSHVWMGGGTDPEEGPVAYVNGGIYANQRNTAAFIVALVNAYREGRLSERTEGAGEVALSEEEREGIHGLHRTAINPTAAGCPLCFEASQVFERILARRALPTAGGAGEVALSEAELCDVVYRSLNRVMGEPDQGSGTNTKRWRIAWEVTRDLLARRALPTAGRVVEVERVAEQVEALADKWAANGARLSGDLAHVGAMWRQRADDLRALADAIRADGSAES